MATFKNIAKKIGFSENIVSRAFHSDRLVRDSTRELIMAVSQKRMGYYPNRAARSSVNHPHETIGIFIKSISEMDYGPIIDGLQFANQAGYTLIDFNFFQGPEFEEWLDRVDGLIILSSHSKEKQRIRQLIDREIPLVLVESYLSDDRANCIRVNHVEGGYIATRHLIGLGHTRIAHITSDLNYQGLLERREGYQKALCESNLPLQPELIITGNYSEADGYQAMKRLLAYKTDFTAVFTAVFAASDIIALGVLKAIDEAGLSVPGDISVIGYDDIEFSKNTNPPLTTVRQPRFEMGERAMAILTAILQNHLAMNKGMKICFLPELVIRGTTHHVQNNSNSPIALVVS